MDYYAEDIQDLPSLSYIVLVGPVHEKLSDELHQRIQRIKEASPEKDKMALDVRGITELETDDFEQFREIQDTLNQIGWDLYFCNIPSRHSNFFNAKRVQRQFSVFSKKSDLIQHLKEEKNENQVTEEPDPIPVVFRTADGIRLFEGQAEEKQDEKLIINTDDHNAKMFQEPPEKEIQLYFDSPELQMVPQTIEIADFEIRDDKDSKYQVEAKLPELSKGDQRLLNNYFKVS